MNKQIDADVFQLAKALAKKRAIRTIDVNPTVLLMDMRGVYPLAGERKRPVSYSVIDYSWGDQEEKVRKVVKFHAEMEVFRERVLAEYLELNIPSADIPLYYSAMSSCWMGSKPGILPSNDPNKKECLTVEAYHITGYPIGGSILEFVRCPKGKIKKFKAEKDEKPDDLLAPAGIFTLRDHNPNFDKLWLSDYNDVIEDCIKVIREQNQEERIVH